MPEVFDATFREIAELAEPAVVWESFPVQEMRHEAVILAGGQRIGNGPVTTVMGGASHLAIGVCTVGAAVSDRIHQHKAGLLGGAAQAVTVTNGLNLLFAACPAAFGGWLSAIAQGRVAVAGINLVAKKPEEFGKAMLMTVMVETYAVLALLISFLLVNGVQIG